LQAYLSGALRGFYSDSRTDRHTSENEPIGVAARKKRKRPI
jgi:hypothetical protein